MRSTATIAVNLRLGGYGAVGGCGAGLGGLTCSSDCMLGVRQTGVAARIALAMATGLIALAIGGLVGAGAQAEAAPLPCKEIAVKLPDGVHLNGWFRPADGGGRQPVL